MPTNTGKRKYAYEITGKLIHNHIVTFDNNLVIKCIKTYVFVTNIQGIPKVLEFDAVGLARLGRGSVGLTMAYSPGWDIDLPRRPAELAAAMVRKVLPLLGRFDSVRDPPTLSTRFRKGLGKFSSSRKSYCGASGAR